MVKAVEDGADAACARRGRSTDRRIRARRRRWCSTPKRGFAIFDGTPLCGVYKNMKAAVAAVFTGKERVFNPRYMAVADLFMAEPTACLTPAGWKTRTVTSQV